MTEHLAATGAPVHAIELDASLARRLQRLTLQFPNLTVVPGDVLQANIGEIAAGRRVRIYGNLPYYITSPILHHLFTFANLIDEMHIVIQSEVAERLTARPNSKPYGYLSVATQLYARPELVLHIPREAFSPPPEVGSALVTLRFPGERARLSQADEAKFLDFVKLCFAQKRKTLVNNLRSMAAPDRVREALLRRDFFFRPQRDQAIGVIAHDAVHAGFDQQAHVRRLIHRPAHDLQVAFARFRE